METVRNLQVAEGIKRYLKVKMKIQTYMESHPISTHSQRSLAPLPFISYVRIQFHVSKNQDTFFARALTYPNIRTHVL